MTARSDEGETLPTVSVIMTAHNEERGIADSLASLVRVNYPPDRSEILIVDNGSTDDTAQIIRRFPVRYLYEPRRGVCHGRNLGIGSSIGKILAFTDPDCVVSTGWLRELVRPFADEKVGIVAGAIVPYPPHTLPELHAARRRSHSQERPLAHPRRPFAMTPNIALRREVFLAAGMFDTRFPGGGWEDADLCWRVRSQTPWVVQLAPKAIVFHRYRSTVRDFITQQYRYGFGLGLLYAKYERELCWGWKERAMALANLASTAGRMGLAGALYCLGVQPRTDLDLRALDLGRELAQRVGFSVARLWARPSPSS